MMLRTQPSLLPCTHLPRISLNHPVHRQTHHASRRQKQMIWELDAPTAVHVSSSQLDNPRSGNRNIVLAIDVDAQGSYRALQYTLQHIYRQGDVLHLLHVVPAGGGLLAQGQCLAYTMPPEEGLQGQMALRAQQYFEHHYMPLAQQSGATVQLDLVHGSCRQTVTNTICQKVQDLAAELVVLPVQRKRSFMQDLFQAPVSQQLAQVCPCPTLIIHDAT